MPLGDHEHARRSARTGTSAEPGIEGAEQLRAFVAAGLLPGLDHPDIDVVERGEARPQAGQRLVGLRHALADRLRAGTVDDDGDDLLQGRPVLPHQGGVEKRQHDEGETERPQPDRPLPQHETEDDDRGAGKRQRDEQTYGQQRREGEGIIGHAVDP